MPKQQTFHLASDFKDAALPTALRALLPHLSWSQIKGLVRQRRVQVNGNLCLDEGRTVKAGDVIRVSDQSLAAPVTAKEVRIVHVDQHVVVIDKPPGVTTLRKNGPTSGSSGRRRSMSS
jgi:23S rRNA pseudouridine1911/1915/1917 synthase